LARSPDRAHGYTFGRREEEARWRSGQPRRPAGNPCKGPCNHRWRQAQKTLDTFGQALKTWQDNPVGNPPAEPQIPEGLSPYPGDPVFCGRCYNRYHQQLDEIGDLAAIAEAENTGHRTGPDAERVTGSRYAPSPSPVCDDLDELASMLRGWDSDARGLNDIPPRAGYLQSEIGTLVARLTSRHYPVLMADAVRGPEFAGEVAWWHRRLRGTTKTGTGRHHKPMPCPRCGGKTLEWEEGATYVECMRQDKGIRTCGKLLSLDDYDATFTTWIAGGGAPHETPQAIPGAA
jgi:hypothetical protein